MPTPALLIIDMQKTLVKGAWEEASVVECIASLASRVRTQGHAVIYIQHCHATWQPMMKGQPGWEIDDRLKPEPGDPVIEKQASDAFYQTFLEETLRRRAIDTLLITGMQTEYCVDTTCRSALSHGFDVVLVSDGHTTGNAQLSAQDIIRHHNAVLPNLAHPAHRVVLRRGAETSL
jgi:nicotinamidase-related amidase